LVAALEFHGRRRVDATLAAARGPCPALILVLAQRGPAVARDAAAAGKTSRGWQEVARERRPTDRNEVVVVYRRPVVAPEPTVTRTIDPAAELTPPAPSR
jgi:hypothetical protein